MALDWQGTLRNLRRCDPGEMAQIARETGVAYSNVWRIRAGLTANPRIGTVVRLARYFERQEREKVAA